MSRAWQGGSTRAWRNQRAQVLIRDNGLCQLQLPGCDTYATAVHHKLGIDISGKVVANLDELQAACTNCNRAAGQPTTDPEPQPRTRW